MSAEGVDVHSGSAGSEAREIDKLLELAEGLQRSCDDAERRIYTRWFVASIAASFIVISSVFVQQAFPVERWGLTITVISVLYAASFLGATAFLSLRTSKKLHRDARALYSIVDMLREIEGPIAQKGGMSTLERAQFRIRLSRFGIGTGSRH